MSVQENRLKAIADAIRYAENSTALIPAPMFPDRIRALKGSGGSSGGGMKLPEMSLSGYVFSYETIGG